MPQGGKLRKRHNDGAARHRAPPFRPLAPRKTGVALQSPCLDLAQGLRRARSRLAPQRRFAEATPASTLRRSARSFARNSKANAHQASTPQLPRVVASETIALPFLLPAASFTQLRSTSFRSLLSAQLLSALSAPSLSSLHSLRCSRSSRSAPLRARERFSAFPLRRIVNAMHFDSLRCLLSANAFAFCFSFAVSALVARLRLRTQKKRSRSRCWNASA